MKIRETIQGASENTVVYENSAGKVVSVTRPKIFTLEQMIAEIEADGKKASAPKSRPAPVPKEGGSAKESPSPDPSPSGSSASKSGKGEPSDNATEQERRPQ